MINKMRKYFGGSSCDFKLIEFLEERAKVGDLAEAVEMLAKAMDQASKANIRLADVHNEYEKIALEKCGSLGAEYKKKAVLIDEFLYYVIIKAVDVNILNKACEKIIARKPSKITNLRGHTEIESCGSGAIINNKGEFSSIKIRMGASKILNTGGYSSIVAQFSNKNHIIVNKSSNTRIEIKGGNSIIIDGGLGSKIIVRGTNNRIYSSSTSSEFHLVGDDNVLNSTGSLSKTYICGGNNKVNCLGNDALITQSGNESGNRIYAPNGDLKEDDWFTIFDKS